jgi:hypothetical protein
VGSLNPKPVVSPTILAVAGISSLPPGQFLQETCCVNGDRQHVESVWTTLPWLSCKSSIWLTPAMSPTSTVRIPMQVGSICRTLPKGNVRTYMIHSSDLHDSRIHPGSFSRQISASLFPPQAPQGSLKVLPKHSRG